MKSRLFILGVFLFVSAAASAATENCRLIKKNVRADIDALGKFLEASADVLSTRSNVPLEMVKEYFTKEHGDWEETTFTENVDEIELEESEAGTTSKGVLRSLIEGTAEQWFLDDDDNETKEQKEKKFKAALDKVLKHKLEYGFVAGLQGWGGSGAAEALFLHPRCKLVSSLFLGITHD